MSAPFQGDGADSVFDLRELGLQIATRLVAVVRTGRSYAIGNPVFSRQLEQLFEVLAPVFLSAPAAQLVEMDGDLHLNGQRLPLRPSSLKFTEQLQHELHERTICGLEFGSGLAHAELEAFMRLFLASELHKGADLLEACRSAQLHNIRPVLTAVWAVESRADDHPDEISAAYGSAMAAYDRALHNSRVLLAPQVMQNGLELRHLKRVAQPLVDAALGGEPPVALTEMRHGLEYGWAHAVHVCLVAVTLGRHLGLDRHALAELGVAALLHDVGKDTPPASLAAPMEEWGAAQWSDARRHTTAGLKRLARCATLDGTTLWAMRTALEHHADGPDGHPELPQGCCEMSRIVGIADVFVSLLAHRSERGSRLTPHDALALVLGPFGQRFHPALRAALVRAVGVFPPGQIVELDDGSIARVLGCESNDPRRPALQILLDAQGNAVGAETSGQLVHLPAGRSVRRALPLSEWPAAEAA